MHSSHMPRYFFNFLEDKDSEDTEGGELPHLTSAETEAAASILELARGHIGGTFAADRVRIIPRRPVHHRAVLFVS